MDAYRRQLTPGEYPLAVVMIDIKSDLVDVNVHPSKLQVKFLDSQKIYQLVYDNVYNCLGENKIAEVTNNYYEETESTNLNN
jgi:DNA mismatch repair protein MutL